MQKVLPQLLWEKNLRYLNTQMSWINFSTGFKQHLRLTMSMIIERVLKRVLTQELLEGPQVWVEKFKTKITNEIDLKAQNETFIQWSRFYSAEKYVKPSLASPDRAPIIRDPGFIFMFELNVSKKSIWVHLGASFILPDKQKINPVSYTHLTLPTKA